MTQATSSPCRPSARPTSPTSSPATARSTPPAGRVSSGLSDVLAERTALEPGEPIGVDPERDELAFFPLIYWPIAPDTATPSSAAMARIDAYMRQGGSVLFDTRDQLERSTSFIDLLRHAGGRAAARHAGQPRHSAARAGAGRPCADQGVLPAQRLPRPLCRRAAMGAGDRRHRAQRPAGAGRRRRLLDPHHRERLRRRMGDRRKRRLPVSDRAQRSAPARDGLSRRRQHRHVHADRQLQGRPGACARPCSRGWGSR